jgi:hypothetical protein
LIGSARPESAEAATGDPGEPPADDSPPIEHPSVGSAARTAGGAGARPRRLWHRRPADDLLPAEARRRRRRRFGGGALMLALSLGTTWWWQEADPEPTDGGRGVVSGAAADRADARPIEPGGETTLAAAYAPVAELHAAWGDWSQVTPPAIGAVVRTLGVVDAAVAPERADEISLAVDARGGVVLGALDLAVGPADCVWLRDRGFGPEVAHERGAGDCSAAAAPATGWVAVTI